MLKEPEPVKAWQGKFGAEYTERNDVPAEALEAWYLSEFKISRRALYQFFFGNIDRKSYILEVGCNIGLNLELLQEMGFKYLYGIDVNTRAIEICRKRIPEAIILEGRAEDLPFVKNHFDVVMTSGVLIHIHPENLRQAMSEIVRCSMRYVFGYEFFSQKIEHVTYRGVDNLLWKRNFCSEYLDLNMSIVERVRLPYTTSNNIDEMFLLEKRNQ